MFQVKQFKELNSQLNQILTSSTNYQNFQLKLQNRESCSISGLEGTFLSIFIANIFNSENRDVLILCKNENESEKIRDDLDFIIGVDRIAFLPDHIETNIKEENQIFSFFLNDVLTKITNNKKSIFITTKEGLKSEFPNNSFITQNSHILKLNKEIERENFEDILIEFGYKREDMVLYPKDFCVKGSIIDFFPPDKTHPVRVEFFDNTIHKTNLINDV